MGANAKLNLQRIGLIAKGDNVLEGLPFPPTPIPQQCKFYLPKWVYSQLSGTN